MIPRTVTVTLAEAVLEPVEAVTFTFTFPGASPSNVTDSPLSELKLAILSALTLVPFALYASVIVHL